MCDLFERAEAAEAFEWGDGEGHFGLVVVVWVVLGVFCVELLGELLVWVGLDGECFVDGEHLEEEGEFVVVFGRDVAAHEGLVICHEVDQRPACGEILGRQRWVGTHP